MPEVVVISHLERHVPTPTCGVRADTVGAALGAVVAEHRAPRGYGRDDQGHLRRHEPAFCGGVWDSEDRGDAWRVSDARLPPIYPVRFAP
jgi:hypothetical protein